MIYELRTYEAAPGKMKALQERFEKHSLRLLAKHGMTLVGFWTPVLGGWSNQLVYLLSYPDLGAREAAWAGFQGDPEWHAARDASEKDGPLVARLRGEILKPTAFSPLR